VLVKMLPAYDDLPNKLQLDLSAAEGKKRHYEHTYRRGVVASVGKDVKEVKKLDVIIFRGDAGFTMDGDPEVENEIYGEGYRWLKAHECLAVEERV